MNAFQIELTRAMLFFAAASLISFIFTMWVLYIVIKSAIRDGIRESGLVQTWQRTAADVRRQRSEHTLPDMRAD